jgi:hypothetical protein
MTPKLNQISGPLSLFEAKNISTLAPDLSELRLTWKRDDLGNLILRGPIQRADTPNKNWRKYPIAILKREVNKYIEEQVLKGTAYCELDHPDEDNIAAKNACARILDIWWEGNDVMADILVLPEGTGKIVAGMIETGGSIGISSRGAGSVVDLPDGYQEIQDDYQLFCWDFVTDPSTHEAYVGPQKINEKGSVQNKRNIIKRRINNLIREIFESL